MLTDLQLKNFRIWQNTGKVALKPVTLLLGTNSSGKSSLIQSLLLLKQTVQSPDRKIHLNLGGDESNDLFNFGSFDRILRRDAEQRRVELEFALEMMDENERVRKVFFSCAYVTNAKRMAVVQELTLSTEERKFRVKRSERDAYALYCNDDSSALRKDRDLAPERSLFFSRAAVSALGHDGTVLEDLSSAIYRQFKDVMYLGPLRRRPERDYVWNKSTPDRLGSDGYRVIDVLLSSALSKDKEHQAVFRDVSHWLARMGLADKLGVWQLGRTTRYEVVVHRHGVVANLRDVGIGISQVLPVLTVACFAPPGSTVILEEPEIHLHPLAQSVLAELFVEVSQERKIQFLVETHSEHMFRRMQTLLAEKKASAETVAMYFVEREGAGAVLRPLVVDEFGAVKNWPEHFFGDTVGETRRQAVARINRQMSQNHG